MLPPGPCPHLFCETLSTHLAPQRNRKHTRDRWPGPGRRYEASSGPDREREGTGPKARSALDLVGGPAQDSEGDTGESSQNSQDSWDSGEQETQQMAPGSEEVATEASGFLGSEGQQRVALWQLLNVCFTVSSEIKSPKLLEGPALESD